MPPKTQAEIQRAYRQRKLERDGPSKKKEKKTQDEFQSEYGERKKQADSSTFLEKERERKWAAYTPTALLSESAKAKRRKENRETAKRFREKLTRTKSTGDVEKETKDVCKFPTLHVYSLVIRFSLASRSLARSLDLDLDLFSSPYHSLASLSVSVVLRGVLNKTNTSKC